MTAAVTIELRPPRWWKGLRVFFLVAGAVNAAVGVLIVVLVTEDRSNEIGFRCARVP